MCARRRLAVLPRGLLALPGLLALAAPATAQDATDIAAAVTPGAPHRALARFIGTWDVEISLFLPGEPPRAASGRATYEWLVPDRWIAQRMTDDLLGERHESFAILGYDNFADGYVLAGVSSFDTALHVSRGPAVDPAGEVLVTYGTQDDYATGVLHKPYRIVTRILDQDHHVVETWDLARGPAGAMVLEYRYSRR